MYLHLHRRFRAAPQRNVTIDSHKPHTAPGFTIVELLVVIVVIAILAAITIVAYTGISSKATVASLISDLDTSSKQLKIFQVINGAYPTANNCPTPGGTEICLKSSGGTVYVYTSTSTTNPQSFALTATKSGTSYIIADNTTPGQISADPTNLNCPSGFIPVPGSITYGTADFCVMKYGAKNVGGVATSQAALTPWVSISQTDSITTSAAACTGCHLITEAEYLTIAQNVLNVASNWSSGTVGTGYIYSGHNDSSPANALVADTNDANGYASETNTGGNQKRTLTLSNGEVIWDLAGNVWEWTSGTMTGGQPTGMASWNWYQWTAVSGGTFAVNPYPSGTGISGSNTWDSTKGIGQIYGLTSDASLRGFRRGGDWSSGGSDGVLTLLLSGGPSYTTPTIGFRVSR